MTARRAIFPAGLLVAALFASADRVPAAAGDLGAAIGARLFERAWIPAPSSAKANDGLGPLYNARSCAACHPGGGHADAGGGKVPAGLVVRLGDPAGRPDPVYGFQIQTQGVPGVAPEASVSRTEAAPVLAALADGPLGPGTASSFRVAPDLHGVGLLEGVPDAAIDAIAAGQKSNPDGIRGRAHRLADGRIGRFGWKAGQPTLESQVASALSIDLGLSTRLAPAPWGDCTAAQEACIAAPHGARARDTEGGPEIADDILAMLTAHVAALPPPVPAGDERPGAALFASTGCAACHVPALPGRDGTPVKAFTDLLLHDMGPELDGLGGDGTASGRDWRTAPLWGLGERRDKGLLHDGRADSIAEAIDRHGGEAARARDRYQALTDRDRAALLGYLASL
jgi:CxxC motif-containing protein (DUF1111 family)